MTRYLIVSSLFWRAKSLWHFVICNPAFSNREAATLPTAVLLAGKPVCRCGKVVRR